MFNRRAPLIISLVMVFLLLNAWLYYLFTAIPIATVDVTAITREFIQQQLKEHQTDAVRQRAIKVFAHDLEHALYQLSRSTSHVLLPKEAVLAGSPDYTKRLQAMLKHARTA